MKVSKSGQAARKLADVMAMNWRGQLSPDGLLSGRRKRKPVEGHHRAIAQSTSRAGMEPQHSIDGLNFNPDRPDGSVAERVADALSRLLLRRHRVRSAQLRTNVGYSPATTTHPIADADLIARRSEWQKQSNALWHWCGNTTIRLECLISRPITA